MNLFHKIEGAVAIVRGAKCVEKQVDMYRRGDRVYVPVGQGFARVTTQFNGVFGTAHPAVNVIEFEAEGVELKGGLEPRFVGAPGLKAVA